MGYKQLLVEAQLVGAGKRGEQFCLLAHVSKLRGFDVIMYLSASKLSAVTIMLFGD